MLRTAHKLTAISNPTPLLLKAKDSSKMMPAYPIPNINAIATSYITRHDQTTKVILVSQKKKKKKKKKFINKSNLIIIWHKKFSVEFPPTPKIN